MSAAARLGGFVALLAAAFVVAALAGAALGGGTDEREPEPAPATEHGHVEDGGEDADAGVAAAGQDGGAAHAGGGGGAGAAGGLATADQGFALELDRTILPARDGARLGFRIVGRDGEPVRGGFEREHARELHLVAVRRDTANFQHVHPRRAADGTWHTRLDLADPGAYRVLADFRLAGRKLTLGADLFAPGEFRPQPLPEPSSSASTDGFEVELESAELRAGRESTLSFAVRRDGVPFEGLQPYLGARGHLVALREGDLAYLHVHPLGGDEAHEHANGSTGAEPHEDEVAFAATFPNPGRYRLYLEFKAEGEVRRVEYTVEARR